MSPTDSSVDPDWNAFPDLPGTHLSWHTYQRGTWTLETKGGEVWAKLRPPVDEDGCTVSANGADYVLREVGGHKRRTSKKHMTQEVNVVDDAGNVVLSWHGAHYRRIAGTHLRTTDGRMLSFPVRQDCNGILMEAIEARVQESPLIRYRLLRGTTWLAPRWMMRQIFSVEVVVSDEALSIPSIGLLIAFTSHLPWYFALVPG